MMKGIECVEECWDELIPGFEIDFLGPWCEERKGCGRSWIRAWGPEARSTGRAMGGDDSGMLMSAQFAIREVSVGAVSVG